MLCRRVVAPLAVVAWLVFAASSAAAPGDLDPAFGGGGLARSSLVSTVAAAALAPDGKIVVGGDMLARYNADGSPDTSFGPDGTAAVAEVVEGLAVQPDGKVVTARGYHDDCQSYGVLLSRFDAAGVLDASFGSGGRVRLPLAFGQCVGLLTGRGGPVAVAPDGKLVLAGYVSRRPGLASIGLARYLPDGTFDPSFNSGAPVQGPKGDAQALVLLPDGRILVGGQVLEQGELGFGLARYMPDGALDTTLDGDGAVQTFVGTGGIAGLALQPDGRIVAAGEGYGRKIVLIRYAVDGSIDASFGSQGRAITAFPGSTQLFSATTAPGEALAVQPSGALVVRGEATFDVAGGPAETTFALARYTPEGRLDSGFGACGGVVTWPAPVSAGARVVLAVGEDRVLALGGASAATGEPGIAIARYRAGAGAPQSCRDPFTPTTIAPPADLSLSIRRAPARRVRLGRRFRLTLVVRNRGPSPAPRASVVVRRRGAVRLAATKSATPRREIHLGTLAPGTRRTVHAIATVKGKPRSPLVVRLKALSTKHDPRHKNDTAVLRLRLFG